MDIEQVHRSNASQLKSYQATFDRFFYMKTQEKAQARHTPQAPQCNDATAPNCFISFILVMLKNAYYAISNFDKKACLCILLKN